MAQLEKTAADANALKECGQDCKTGCPSPKGASPAAAEPEEEPEGEQADVSEEEWVFQKPLSESTPVRQEVSPKSRGKVATVVQFSVAPPPAPCFPVNEIGRKSSAEVPIDTTPCLVEIAATASVATAATETEPAAGLEDETSSPTTASCPRAFGEAESSETAAPDAEKGLQRVEEECERLLPGLAPDPSRPVSGRSSPEVIGSSRCDFDDGSSAPPSGSSSLRSPRALARLLSPMFQSPGKAQPPSCPNSTPVRAPTLTPASGSTWCPPPTRESPAWRKPEEAASPAGTATGVPSVSSSRDFGAWFRAARRVMLPLSGSPSGPRPASELLIAEMCCFGEPASGSSAGVLSWCCAPERARHPAALEAEAAASIPASEERLLLCPRPSTRGLRATSLEVFPTQLLSPPSKQPVAKAEVTPELTTSYKVQTADGILPSPAMMPALPKQAPALPSRAPSGDSAVDAAELLLSRVVDPFGEDGE